MFFLNGKILAFALVVFATLSGCRPMAHSGCTPDSGKAIATERLSPSARRKVEQVAKALKTDPNWLLAAISYETNGTFDPKTTEATTGATGLILFMPQTVERLGHSPEEVRAMNQEQQLELLEEYLRPYAGRLTSIDEVGIAVKWPAAIGAKPETPVLTGVVGYDSNSDGVITKGELTAPYRAALAKLCEIKQ